MSDTTVHSMFTETQFRAIFKLSPVYDFKRTSLVHQLKPELLCLLQCQRQCGVQSSSVVKMRKRGAPSSLLYVPITSLAWDVSRTDNLDAGIGQKEGQEFSVPWFRVILEFEGLDLVLEDVGECDQTTFPSLDGAELLHNGAKAMIGYPINLVNPFVIVLFIAHLPRIRTARLLAEGQTGLGNVARGVVI